MRPYVNVLEISLLLMRSGICILISQVKLNDLLEIADYFHYHE